MVHVGGSEEEVPMDPQLGPMVMQLDGTTTHLQTVRGICGGGQAAVGITSDSATKFRRFCSQKERRFSNQTPRVSATKIRVNL